MPKRINLDKPRSWAGRAGTVIGAAALTASLYTSHALPLAATGSLAVTGIGVLASVRPWRSDVPGAVTMVYGAAPALMLAEMATFRTLIALRVVGGGAHWPELLAEAAWAGSTWWLRPGRIARELADQVSTAPTGIPTAVVVPQTPEQRLVAWWEQAAAVEGGLAPGTHLEYPQVDGPRDLRAHIVAPPGLPVPKISITALSALTDIPPELITIGPVPGSGTGRMAWTVASFTTQDAEPETQLTDQEVWAQRIAPQVMKGSVLIDVRRGNTKTGEMYR